MKLCAFGELLIDVTPYGISDKGYELCEFNPGGAPANVAVALRNLEQEASFIGQVGNDHYGNFLRSVLREKSVDVDGLVLSSDYLTTLAMVSLGEGGERSFSFYRQNGADVMMKPLPEYYKKIEEADIFHFGSVTMSDEPSRSTTFELLEYAKKIGKIISFDPNLRELLWDDLREAKRQIKKALPFTDILKVSEEELYFLTEIKDVASACTILSHGNSIPLILVTFGAKGSAFFIRNHLIEVPGFSVKAIDTTGAGDGFLGGFLSRFMDLKKPIEMLSLEELTGFLRFANACGAYATLKKGAIGALATPSRLKEKFGDQPWIG